MIHCKNDDCGWIGSKKNMVVKGVGRLHCPECHTIYGIDLAGGR